MAVTAIGDRRFCTAPINGLAENDNERAPKINKHNYRFRFSAMKSMDDTARKLHFMSCLHGTLFFWPQYFGVLCVCCVLCVAIIIIHCTLYIFYYTQKQIHVDRLIYLRFIYGLRGMCATWHIFMY